MFPQVHYPLVFQTYVPPHAPSRTLPPSLNMSSVKTPAKRPSHKQRRRRSAEAATEPYPFSDLKVEDNIMDQLSWSASWSMMQSSSGRGCACEEVQLSTMDQSAAWQVMSLRYKAVHSHAVCASPCCGANAPDPRESDLPPHRANVPHAEHLQARKHRADVLSRTPARSAGHSPAVCAPLSSPPLDPRESDPLPHRANVPHAEDLRAMEPRVEMVRSRTPARSTGPIVLSAPLHLPSIFHTRVAMKLTMQAVGADSRTCDFSRYVGAFMFRS